MEISDSSTIHFYESARLMSERAAVVHVQESGVSRLNEQSSKRIVATNLAGAGSSEIELPLSSGGDVRSVTIGKPQGSDDLESDSARSELPDLAEGTVSSAGDSSSSTELTSGEEEQIRQLKARDLEVRQHEQAHVAAAGSYVSGGIQYEYQTGPDGKQYAIGGHVNLDTSKENDPETTMAKARQIQRAALAPADPSPQDVRVAAKAAQMILEAQRELIEVESEERAAAFNGETGEASSSSTSNVSRSSESLETPTVQELGLIDN